jgi:hypothetical protein
MAGEEEGEILKPFDEWYWSTVRRPTLVGPIPMTKTGSGCFVPDYRHPGVRERIAAEVDYVETLSYDKRKL